MKQTMLLPALALAGLTVLPASAQTRLSDPGLQHFPTQKGSMLIGANLVNAAAGLGNGHQSFYSFGASPRAGYFLTDNFAIGATLNGSFSGSSGFRSNAYGGGLFGRYYFGRIADKDGNMNRLRPFLEAGINHTTGVARFEDFNGLRRRISFNSTNVYGIAGINYFLTKNVALELGLSYQRYLGRPSSIGNQSQLGLNVGMQFFLPIRSKRQPRPLPGEQ